MSSAARASSAAVPLALRGVSHVTVNGRVYRMVTPPLAETGLSPVTTTPQKRTAEILGEDATAITPAGEDEPPCQIASCKPPALCQAGLAEVRMNLPPAARRAVIGRGGHNLRQLKANSGASIVVPQTRNEDVVISGTAEAVAKARIMVQEVSDRAVLRLQPTHFLSLPISDTHTHRKIETFVNQIRAGRLDIPEAICVTPSRLHITVGMLNLHTEELVRQAVQVLTEAEREILEEVLGGKPVSIDLAGVKIMEENPEKAHVMYIVPTESDGSGRLTKLCEFLIKKFTERGLMKQDERLLKLHVTIINTKYGAQDARKKLRAEAAVSQSSASLLDEASATAATAPSLMGSVRKAAAWRSPFSAREILNRYGTSVTFGTCRLMSVAVACRHEFVAETGAYKHEGYLRLP